VYAAPDERHARVLGAHHPGELQAVADLRPTHTGQPGEQGLADVEVVVVLQPQVGDARPVARLSQGARHVQELQGHLRVGRLESARKDQQDLVARALHFRDPPPLNPLSLR